MLISCPETCLVVLNRNYYSSKVFEWNLFGGIFKIFCIHGHIIVKKRQCYFFLSNLDVFDFYSCLIAPARTSGTMLNRSGDNGKNMWMILAMEH